MNTTMTDSDARPTSAQLKADIDAGRTGDKVNNADPGLSALGTDDEAAGHPPTAERIQLARNLELKQGRQAGEPLRDTRRMGPSVWIMLAVVVAIAASIIGFVLMR
jgi:hypothetical protein